MCRNWRSAWAHGFKKNPRAANRCFISPARIAAAIWPPRLRLRGQSVTTVVVYRAIKADKFPPAAAAALAAGQIEGVLHFSRRSAEAYIDCARAGGILAQALAVTHFCLSAPIAEPLTAEGAKRIRIAARPEEGALIELVEAGAR